MNTTHGGATIRRTLTATAVASILLAACTTAPVKPDGSAQVRMKLTELQSDPNLASRAAAAIKDADVAVREAEQPETNKELAGYRVYIADRKVDTAKALAETRLAEDQRAALSAQRDSDRLDARTREADVAKGQVATARAEGAEQKAAADRARTDANTAQLAAASSEQQAAEQVATARTEGAEQKAAAERARTDANTAQLAAASSEQQAAEQVATARTEGAEQKAAAERARTDANTAQLAAASSEQQAAELQRQIDVLHAKPTDRGLVLTLGDVLFTSGRADLKSGATGNLNKLVAFLNKYPDRSASIQGYTDSVGNEDYNQGLSERRAESVKSYLAGQGIGTTRLSASGRGSSDPVAGNDSAAGRQQNRRVEVIISNPPAALR